MRWQARSTGCRERDEVEQEREGERRSKGGRERPARLRLQLVFGERASWGGARGGVAGGGLRNADAGSWATRPHFASMCSTQPVCVCGVPAQSLRFARRGSPALACAYCIMSSPGSRAALEKSCGGITQAVAGLSVHARRSKSPCRTQIWHTCFSWPQPSTIGSAECRARGSSLASAGGQEKQGSGGVR
jgi:hypothetical protein